MLRRSFVCASLGIPALWAAAEEAANTHTGHGTAALSPDKALAQLMEGNRRYAAVHPKHPHQNTARRKELIAGQHPFACILACADSRVSPEIVFDEGLGDLFVVRVAGNIVDDAVTGSLEYAVEHLGTPLILVMGHNSCGAVTAATGDGEPSTHIQSLVTAIAPAVAEAKQRQGDLVSNAIEANVRLVVRQLSTSEPILSKAIAGGKLKIAGGTYQLSTGLVKLLA